MSSLSNIRKLIAQLNEEDELWQKETDKHFEDQRNKYKDMFERIKQVKGNTEKCIDDITKGLDYLISNEHTIEKALKQTENIDGLQISPEQQENAIDLINKMIKFMNNTELITSPNPVSPEQIQNDVVSYTENVAQDLMDCRNNLRAVKALQSKTQLLHALTTGSAGKKESHDKSQHTLYTITENE